MIAIGHMPLVSGVLIKLDINTCRYIPILARFSFGSIIIVEGLLDVVIQICTLQVHTRRRPQAYEFLCTYKTKQQTHFLKVLITIMLR